MLTLPPQSTSGTPFPYVFFGLMVAILTGFSAGWLAGYLSPL